MHQQGRGAAKTVDAKAAQERLQVQEGAARLKQDLRSSHFALGSSKDLKESSSSAQYRPPPFSALIGTGDTTLAVERMRRGNFNLADGTGSNSTETALQGQNKAL